METDSSETSGKGSKVYTGSPYAINKQSMDWIPCSYVGMIL